jgi:ketosteroid isomerase-like protein
MKLLVSLIVVLTATQSPTPQAIVDELLAADRSFAAAAAKTTVVPALSAMFAEDVVLPTPMPDRAFVYGKAQAVEVLKANPANADARLQWAPLSGGIAADGQHGFTLGYMTLTTADGKAQPLKYVAYWVKKPAGWRVAIYRRVPADAPPSSREMLPPSLPSRIVGPNSDVAGVAKHKSTLEAAEKAFSDEAQKIGLGAAFAKYGSDDAVNVGPRTSGDFVIGAANIGKSVGAGSEGKPSPVAWAADEGSIVASSGDLGVTFGFIRPHAAVSGKPGAVPFFTIWRRADPAAPWRYIAE